MTLPSFSSSSHKHILVASGLCEICFAICLGWYLAMIIANRSTKTASSPMLNFRRVLQAHIDFILMGILQMVVSMVTSELFIPNWVLYMFVFGSWANAFAFLILAVSESYVHSLGVRIYTIISFLSLSIAYPAFAYLYINKYLL
ncbi:hypothetical protein FDP41_011351 [Naegleria fowleri]|uniref:Uncharacterized protein n=1 Tax=Naegleria fowleri TaxID=5763 RepID=A0A6A5C5R3_NAEFO|nr:uncharacterized protein FDP41_011351 [Naegleria fowleri]KAF0982421.1 hypothetical protein FDP41_011351 [Naegleria fowleri]CAG4714957.1 unnamed protein product [Naegleria fowleri]